MTTATTTKGFSHQCQRPACRYEWQSLNKRPGVCPRCKSYKWDEKPKGKRK